MQIVLDTNVLISGILNARGAPGSILNTVLNGHPIVMVDDRILSEYRSVLRRPKFQFPIDHIESILDFLEHEGILVTAGPTSGILPDPKDAPFYEVAIAGSADYLVTGNTRHFPSSPLVVSPREFIEVLRGSR